VATWNVFAKLKGMFSPKHMPIPPSDPMYFVTELVFQLFPRILVSAISLFSQQLGSHHISWQGVQRYSKDLELSYSHI